MAWSVTFNGNTYTDADMKANGGFGYVTALSSMLADVAIDLAAKVAAALGHANAASDSANAAASSAGSAADSVTAAQGEVAAALGHANTAGGHATNAGNSAGAANASALLAADWAAKTDGAVAGGEYSAKYWAQQAAAIATGQLIYMGAWDASGGTYPPAPVKGAFWKVSVAGLIGGMRFEIGDDLIYNGAAWDKIDNRAVAPVEFMTYMNL